MKSKFLLLFSLIIFAGLANADFAYDNCKFVAETYTKQFGLPKKVDDVTTFSEISCKEGVPVTLQYIYTLANYIPEENKPKAIAFIRKTAYPVLKDLMCKVGIDDVKRFDIEALYRDLNNFEISTGQVVLKDCEKNLDFTK